MIKKESYFSNMFRKMKKELEKKDVDISVAINVTPATISNWQNFKSIPRKKDIQKISKYFVEELQYKYLNIAEKINNYIIDVEKEIPSDNFNQMLKAREQNKYSKVMMIILECLCEKDRENRYTEKKEDMENSIFEENIKTVPSGEDGFKKGVEKYVNVNNETEAKEVIYINDLNNYTRRRKRYIIILFFSVIALLLITLIVFNQSNNKNLIRNGDFEDGLDYWGGYDIHSGGLEYNIDIDNNTKASGNKSFRVLTYFINSNHPEETENWYTIQICQDGLDITAGEKYIVEFKVKSDDTRDCEIIIQKNSDDRNSLVIFDDVNGNIFDVDNGWKTIQRVFTAKESSGDTRFSFGIGGMESDLWFDDIMLYKYKK